jgi:3-oxoacyl-[acyl-carrier protein] reductase
VSSLERSLSERVALITGAGGGLDGGIGAGIARVLAREGATIAVNDVDAESAAATVAELVEAGAEARAFVADIGRSEESTALIADVLERFGRLDIVVNNAGIVGIHTVEETPDEEWAKVIGVNLTGPFLVTRAAIPSLRQSDCGRIIFIASIAGTRIGTLGGAVYTVSKAGVLGLMRHLAAELGSSGITVNAIVPGMMMTPLVDRRTTPQTKAELFAAVPAGRGATTDEIGEMAAFLASERAGYVNGADITIDGGRTVLPGDFSAWARASGLPLK